MRVLTATNGAKRAHLTATFWTGRPVLQVGQSKYQLPRDVRRCQIVAQGVEHSTAWIVVCVLLGITIYGLILAIPLWFVKARRKQLSVTVETHDGQLFTVATDSTDEANRLVRMAGQGAT